MEFSQKEKVMRYFIKNVDNKKYYEWNINTKKMKSSEELCSIPPDGILIGSCTFKSNKNLLNEEELNNEVKNNYGAQRKQTTI